MENSKINKKDRIKQSEEEIQIQMEYIERIKKINNTKNLELNNSIEKKYLKYSIYTMGCKLNENDSEKLAGMLEKMGYVKEENIHNADLVIFNTCCIRENAEDKLLGKIGEFKNKKEVMLRSLPDV